MKKIAIVGAGGVEGKSAFAYYKAQPDVEISVRDQKPLQEADYPGAKVVTGPNYLDGLNQYDLVVHSPGIRPDSLSVDSSKITTATQEFFAQCPAPIIGVTGTKGKGTTSTLISMFLRSAGYRTHLLGNIGKPCLDELSKIRSNDWVVFELSSFQLFDLQVSPHIAVHLMLEPDHQDWHVDMTEYTQAKMNIFRYQKPIDTAVYYAGSKMVKLSAESSAAATKIPYDKNQILLDGAYVEQSHIMMRGVSVAQISDVQLVGAHMLDNVCAAVAATWDVVQDKSIYRKTLSEFMGLPHRLQPIRTLDGVEYVDDSYSATPTATQAAIRAFTQPKVVILGGYDKGADFVDLARTVKDGNVRHALVVGDTTEKIIRALKGAGFKDYSQGYTTMAQIVKAAREHASAGDIVLLAPGCASFDMFQNFTDRGEQFIGTVNDLK